MFVGDVNQKIVAEWPARAVREARFDAGPCGHKRAGYHDLQPAGFAVGFARPAVPMTVSA
jgi:hypothetical protein